jgi:methylase of polypeptide subunit release factors
MGKHHRVSGGCVVDRTEATNLDGNMKQPMNDLNISSAASLARLAIDLGAASVGGPFGAAEKELAGQAVGEPALDPAIVDQARQQIEAGGDPLGDVFSILRTPAERRAQGQFWTPPEILEPMVDWAFAAHPTRIVDPGCGSGRFGMAAVRRQPDLAVIAIDLDPLATLMSRANLAVLGAANALVLCQSYLSVQLPPHQGITAYVGNPPYVRHHDLSSEVKAWATATAKEAGQKISGLAGLHALFFLATAVHASPGDIGSFVTSAEWLDVGYGSIVRYLLTNGLGGRAMDLVDPKAIPFEEVMTTALITCFEVGATPAEISIQLANQASDLAVLGRGRKVAVATLREENRWSYHFRETGAAAHTGRTLRDIARVHRGFATGGNEYFILSRARAQQLGIAAWCKPAITMASEILSSDGEIRDNPQRRLVLDLPANFDRAANPAVDAYLMRGEAEGIDQRYIPSHRKPWFRIGLGEPAPIVVSYMARQAPRFAANPDGLALLNIGHGVYPRNAMSSGQARALVDALNQMRERFPGTGRTYHGGLEKFEPREMESLPIPKGIT